MNEQCLNQTIHKMALNLKWVPVITVSEVGTSFLLITYARPTAAGLEGGDPWWDGAKCLAAPLSTAFSLCGQAAMRSSGLSHRMHLVVPTQHSGVVWFVLPHFPQGSTEPVGWLLGGVAKDFFGSHSHSEFLAQSFFSFGWLGSRPLILASLAPLPWLAHITLGKLRLVAQLTDFEYRKPNPLQTSSSSIFQMTQIQGQTRIIS